MSPGAIGEGGRSDPKWYDHCKPGVDCIHELVETHVNLQEGRRLQMRASASRRRIWASVLSIALLGAAAAEARADDAGVLPDEIVKKPKKKKKAKKKLQDGWHPSLSAGFTFAFSQSQGVVGVQDGISMALGLLANGALVYRKGPHSWISTLGVVHTQSKTPGIDLFIKSADQFQLTSYYQYRFPRLKMLGIVAGAKFSTALLPGSLILAEDTAIDKTPEDPTDFYDMAEAQKAYRLTNAFAPALFKQFVGGLLKPYVRKWLTIDIRLGFGSVEVWTQDGYVLDDNEDTEGILELKQLRDYQQVGGEVQVNITGTAFNKLLTYGFFAEVMFPFYTTIDTGNITGAKLINTELKLALGIKLWKWVSLNYALALVRVPLIQEDWQVTNTLLVTVKANIVK